MMRLATNADVALDLQIVGYQFPENQTTEYDSNWLVVDGRVRHPRGNWTFRDPCLLTYEAARLADWLESVATGCDVSPRVGFLEPNLSFEVVVSEARRILRVTFDLESRPPWSPRGQAAVIDFLAEELELAKAIGDWRGQLRQFPQRAEH